MNKSIITTAIIAMPLAFTACSDNNHLDLDIEDNKYSNYPEDYFTGGKLGTVHQISSSSFEQPAPAVDEQGLSQAFNLGEYFFERPFTENEKPFTGLGPLYIRRSCMHCHIGYGHGKRQLKYDSNTIGNGYILMITDENDIVVQSFGWVAMDRLQLLSNHSLTRRKWILHGTNIPTSGATNSPTGRNTR